ncbi:hypothetical protein PVW51_11840 [Sulfitobacter sp. PR48]|uniref:hypothetical protein n=1 Tax=Sulfitobacter sp. PR48 TaxID=3028383 RepID=UPI00237A9961|nr:hypothetical protein [Sulfitobacter sp. PR48]MDD9721395.1 hypothetical protein [Sulfitobacter sp. PR48]
MKVVSEMTANAPLRRCKTLKFPRRDHKTRSMKHEESRVVLCIKTTIHELNRLPPHETV